MYAFIQLENFKLNFDFINENLKRTIYCKWSC